MGRARYIACLYLSRTRHTPPKQRSASSSASRCMTTSTARQGTYVHKSYRRIKHKQACLERPNFCHSSVCPAPPTEELSALLPLLDLCLADRSSIFFQSCTPLTVESSNPSTTALARVSTFTGLSMKGKPSRLQTVEIPQGRGGM